MKHKILDLSTQLIDTKFCVLLFYTYLHKNKLKSTLIKSNDVLVLS